MQHKTRVYVRDKILLYIQNANRNIHYAKLIVSLL